MRDLELSLLKGKSARDHLRTILGKTILLFARSLINREEADQSANLLEAVARQIHMKNCSEFLH